MHTTANTPRLLIVKPASPAALLHELAAHGFEITLASSPAHALLEAANTRFDALLIDASREQDVPDLCRSFRCLGISVPLVLWISNCTTADKVRGLDAGADEVLSDPFDSDELLARLRALFRRAKSQHPTTHQFSDLRLDRLSRTAWRADRRIDLTAKEFSLLEFFIINPERLLGRTAIGHHVWNADFDPTSNLIEVCLSGLRRKLGPPPLIQTVIGSGYRLTSAAAATKARAPIHTYVSGFGATVANGTHRGAS